VTVFRLTLGALVVATAVVAIVLHERGGTGPSETSADLVRANYRVLSAAQSTRLMTFARDFRSCLDEGGISLRRPTASKTRIIMRVPVGTERARLLRVGAACGKLLGDPPPGASLQVYQRTSPGLVVLYLPKRCLLDPNVARHEQPRLGA
jgi:hypothetical protein